MIPVVPYTPRHIRNHLPPPWKVLGLLIRDYRESAACSYFGQSSSGVQGPNPGDKAKAAALEAWLAAGGWSHTVVLHYD